ncbi:Domain of unknown function (DUF305)-containing protein [uncultured virus]|nr:Domain of unknown function (DUF305)-containing protein [uncultured virus]
MDSTPYAAVVIMVVASILIAYYITMNVMVSDSSNLTDNRIKGYHALLMGFIMGAIEVTMFMWFTRSLRFIWLLVVLVIISSIIYYLLRNQVGIGENDFLLGMIEHHSMALLMVDKVQPKTTDPELLQLQKVISTSQTAEIAQMKRMLKERKVPLISTGIPGLIIG